ncbi:follicle cell protein 3C-1 [Agrilus planipennis]|uniref:Follicle cell protein 3C-1 n=1 Tax=Agrilus planipennis TaxID=224129 RepID=A0A1W4WZL4_AGRPL|nr:follicle cell protein 3C-1 [Agrilus planipennis]XP_018329326.1 follicle cell protein 3C-1 [Agrilus planipennis]
MKFPPISFAIFLTILIVVISFSHASVSDNTIKNINKENNNNKVKGHHHANNHTHPTDPCPCTCGVFLSGQFKKGSKDQPKGNPVLVQEMDGTSTGNKQCINKCLELIVRHLSKSNDIICAMVDRDCVKEKAYLFVKNHSCTWHNSNLSAGREFCCKDNQAVKCNSNS